MSWRIPKGSSAANSSISLLSVLLPISPMPVAVEPRYCPRCGNLVFGSSWVDIHVTVERFDEVENDVMKAAATSPRTRFCKECAEKVVRELEKVTERSPEANERREHLPK